MPLYTHCTSQQKIGIITHAKNIWRYENLFRDKQTYETFDEKKHTQHGSN